MNQAEGMNKKRLWLTEGVVIGISPLIGYIVALIYETGVAEVFEIPYELITLNLTTVLIATGSFILVVFSVFFLVMMDYPGFLYEYDEKKTSKIKEILNTESADKEHKAPLAQQLAQLRLEGLLEFRHPRFNRSLLMLSPPFVLTFVVLFAHPSSRGMWTLVGFLFGLSVFMWLIRRFLIKNDEHKKIQGEASFHDKLGRFFSGGDILIVILWVLLFLAVPYCLGVAKAELKEKFIVIDTSPETVVLRVYGSILIAAHFDRETKCIERGFFVRKVENDPKEKFYLEKIGPLRLKAKEVPGSKDSSP